ncbi:hypothetical protein [Arthrobacter burdickii]|uniref:Uncharacterized protein n=1 Tax=Arthrobacter burdickii TaxID=3035920 RepID=A0ABT8JYJ8_9MICC|nr:hypothetical protein [Arthrobacter burdickii]MDN4610241.1 hypothetical protein [Arthrobacter burdickii]
MDDDSGVPRQTPAGAGARRSGVRMALLVAIAVFAVSIAFVLVYATSLSWPMAILITVVLAGGQAYALRGTLFGGAGTGDKGSTRDEGGAADR